MMIDTLRLILETSEGPTEIELQEETIIAVEKYMESAGVNASEAIIDFIDRGADALT